MLILIDTREQNPWAFEKSEAASLKTGDYSLKGFEDKICIERKGCVEEFANNLGRDFPRFERELGRMTMFPHRFIICDFPFRSVAEYPKSCSSLKAQNFSKMSGKFLTKKITEIAVNYNINIIFFDSRKEAILYVESLMKRIYEKYSKTQ